MCITTNYKSSEQENIISVNPYNNGDDSDNNNENRTAVKTMKWEKM